MRLISVMFMLFLLTTVHAESLNDRGMINEVEVNKIIHVKNEKDIINGIQFASQHHLKISISAVQHSQGGQTLAAHGIVLDMLAYNHVINIDRKKMQVTVEPGMTWRQLQKKLNPFHLSIGVMQSSNIFTVGGAVSVNAHGLDFRLSPIRNTIVSFHLILANGKKIEVSPNKNIDLWRSVIGGYGLLGVISDVTLQLVPDTILKSKIEIVDIHDLNKILFTDIFPKNTSLFLGRLSVAKNEDFLKKMLLITFENTGALSNQSQLENPESMNFIVTPLFNWCRYSDVGKSGIWKLQKIVFNHKYKNRFMSRNNAMLFAIDFAVNHHEKNHADWLQEYFLPPEKLSEFIDYLRVVMNKNHVNLLNATIRYVNGDDQTILSYSSKPSFSIVLYFDQQLSIEEVNQTKLWTQNLISRVERLGGNYYLPYQSFATKEQFKRAYPGYKNFLKIKHRYDSGNLFSSQFFVRYFQ